MQKNREIKSETLAIKIEPALHARIKAAAAFCGISHSAFARMAAIEKAEAIEKRQVA